MCSKRDEYIYEINNLVSNIEKFRKNLKNSVEYSENSIFFNDKEKIKFWKCIESGIRSYLDQKEGDLFSSELLYILGAVYNYHIKLTLEKYLENVE